jgi:hypothetical protein
VVQRKAEKKYLLGAARPSLSSSDDYQLSMPSDVNLLDGETAHSPSDLNGSG